MSKEEAEKLVVEYTKKDYKTVKIVSAEERKNIFLFEFIEADDEFPVDYPMLCVSKRNGEIRELSFLNEEDRKVIFGV